MKKMLQAVLVVSMLAGSAALVRAEDPIKVAPDMYSLVFENEKVRVMQVVFKPGQEIKRHSHPEHYVYVLEGGQLTVNRPEGAPTVADVKAGQVIWFPAETHWEKNTGTTQVKLLVNELKPFKKP